jgi:quercetin dioxygenase-like cupin family protein
MVTSSVRCVTIPAVMDRPEAVIIDRLGALEVEPRRLPVYDQDIGLRLLHEDPDSGEEHYLIGYPPGLKARWHRHTAAHTIVVLEGRLEANGRGVGPGAYCHFPGGVPMHHANAGDEPCLFVILFHGPFDVEVVDGEAGSPDHPQVLRDG